MTQFVLSIKAWLPPLNTYIVFFKVEEKIAGGMKILTRSHQKVAAESEAFEQRGGRLERGGAAGGVSLDKKASFEAGLE